MLGNKVKPWGWKKKEGLTRSDVSSLVIDSLWDQARGQNVAGACFYFDFAIQKEQPSTGMPGTLLKQAVSGLEEVPGGGWPAYEEQKKFIGGRGAHLADIVEVLSYRLPLLKSSPSYASTLWTNAWQDIGSRSLIR